MNESSHHDWTREYREGLSIHEVLMETCRFGTQVIRQSIDPRPKKKTVITLTDGGKQAHQRSMAMYNFELSEPSQNVDCELRIARHEVTTMSFPTVKPFLEQETCTYLLPLAAVYWLLWAEAGGVVGHKFDHPPITTRKTVTARGKQPPHQTSVAPPSHAQGCLRCEATRLIHFIAGPLLSSDSEGATQGG